MPIYEYRCQKCRSRFTELVRNWSDKVTPVCPKCGNKNPERLISSFAYHKSVQTIHEESGEPSLTSGADFYKDPRNVGRWTEKKFKEMGVDMPPEIQQEIDAAREGELPESITED
jgi:putative FmdB family regulatory protein